MKRSGFFVTILLSVSFCLNVQEVEAQEVPLADSLALAAIYNQMGGDTWTDNTNWLVGSVAAWAGVTVSEGRVTRLDLNSNNLQDSIPSEIGNLSGLERLIMGNNPIRGPIPPEIGNLTNLTYLGLYMTDISGVIPSEIGTLINVEHFQMNSCQLHGQLPVEIGNLASLTYLNITKNNLSGNLPATIGNLTNLENIYLYENQFDGSIPVEFGNLSSLTVLNLSDNLLSGSIPVQFTGLASLTNLDLSNNQLSGTIPIEIGQLTTLSTLSLQENQLNGSIPESIGNLVNLSYLGLHSNQLEGTIPTQIGDMSDLVFIYAYNNQLTGSIPPQIGNLADLQLLYLSSNQLSGTIPTEISNLENLQRLSLGSNNFVGAIPVELNSLTQLITLYIPDNSFDELPVLDSLSALSSLNIANNKFTFEDIEPNVGRASSYFSYSPQDSIGSRIDTVLEQGANLLLTVEVGGTANNYQWQRNGVDIPGADGNTYEITSASAADTGAFVCLITNTLATELDLYSQPVRIGVEGITAIDPVLTGIPLASDLHQNYPNPFNPTTTIDYQLQNTSHVELTVFDVNGREVETLLNKRQNRGNYTIKFDASGLSSGIYYYRLKSADQVQIRKMMLIK